MRFKLDETVANDNHKDLTKVKSAAQIMSAHKDEIEACTSARAIYELVKRLFEEANYSTDWTRKFLFNLSKKKSTTDALSYVWNSILSGVDSKLKTIK